MDALPQRRLVVERAVSLSLQAYAGVRGLAGNDRANPSFVIIGGQRCGTTSMYAYLSQHPQVQPSLRKEVHYFDIHYDRGLSWYGGHFPRNLPQGTITGEASPYYLLHPHSPRRAVADLPEDTIFIAMLRDPVSRAHSHHAHVTNKGFEWLEFEEAIEAEPERTDAAWERLLEDPCAQSAALQHFSYLRRGDYLPQLLRWQDAVGRDRLHVLDSEVLFRDPAAVYGQVLGWLGLHDHSLELYEQRNTYRRPPMRTSTRRWLESYFTEPNARLADWLGEEAPDWLHP